MKFIETESFMDRLRNYYEDDSARFWDPRVGMAGRDLDIYPFLEKSSGQVLEYGCGSGSLLLGLAREGRFSKCFGVDISENALSMVKTAWSDIASCEKDRIKLSLFTPVNDLLPSIKSGSINTVISVATIEHVVNPYVVLDELHRIAAPDATLVCSVPNYAYAKHRLQLLFGVQPRTGTDEPVENWRSEGWDGMHLHTFTKSSFDILLRDCGWEPIQWIGAGQRFSWTGVGLLRRRFPGFWSGELIAACKKRNRLETE